MTTPLGAVAGYNPQTGVKRAAGGNPVGVPRALPASRGRSVDPGGAVKVPKLKNGNQNNETSNIPVPYSRVCPLEFLSGFCGRLSPGDAIFVDKYPPGFVSRSGRSAHLNNGTLGTNSMSRVVGVDGINRLLMSSSPTGWLIGSNLLAVTPTETVYGAIYDDSGNFALETLERYRLDGVVKSNDEPGSFTGSGDRDAAIFNIVIQGPTVVNNGYLYYDDGNSEKFVGGKNNQTGVPDSRTIECFARGSVEAGHHVGGVGPPGRTGSPWLGTSGYDFVAQFTGTYSQYPAQCFDRGVRSLDTIYVGLVSVLLDAEQAKMVPGYEEGNSYYYFQYMPFSSRAAWLIQEVQNKFDASMKKDGVDPDTIADNDKARYMTSAQKEVTRTLISNATGTTRHKFDENPFDAIRTKDLENMVGAWRVGRVLDCKAMRYDSYAGGPMDTAFALMVDVGVSWRDSLRAFEGENETQKKEREDAEVERLSKLDGNGKNREYRNKTDNVTNSMMQRPPLSDVIGGVAGSGTNTKPSTKPKSAPIGEAEEGEEAEEEADEVDETAAAKAATAKNVADAAAKKVADAAAKVAENAKKAAKEAADKKAKEVAADKKAKEVAAAKVIEDAKKAAETKAAIPAAASGMSSIPLIPTAGQNVSPRTRSGAGGSEDTVGRMFDEMTQRGSVGASTGDFMGESSAGPPPASPTPSTDSTDAAATGPKTFRRLR